MNVTYFFHVIRDHVSCCNVNMYLEEIVFIKTERVLTLTKFSFLKHLKHDSRVVLKTSSFLIL